MSANSDERGPSLPLTETAPRHQSAPPREKRGADRILLIDDDPLVREYTRVRLAAEGFSVITADSGRDGIALAEGELPDLILLDIRMPGMDGYEVCTALKKSELTRDIPVFFLSAQGDTKNRVQGLDIGADDFIQKPFNPDELFARIRARMRIAELEKENRHLLAAERAVNERLAAALAELKEKDDLLMEELRLARRIQEGLLPVRLLEVSGADFAARYRPSGEIGGDLYDVIPISKTEFGVMIADVSGHGVPAALVAAMTKVTLSTWANVISSPAKLLKKINEEMTPLLRLGQFLTMLFGVVNVETRTLRFATAGHPGPIVVRRDGKTEQVEAAGLVIGAVRTDTGTLSEPQETEVTLRPGDRIVFYTDGLTEVHNEAAELYGEERLLQSISRHRLSTLERMIDGILEESERFRGSAPAADDAAVVAVELIPLAPDD